MTINEYMAFVKKLENFRGEFSAINRFLNAEKISKIYGNAIIMLENYNDGKKLIAANRDKANRIAKSILQYAIDSAYSQQKYKNLIDDVLSGKDVHELNFDVLYKLSDDLSLYICIAIGEELH